MGDSVLERLVQRVARARKIDGDIAQEDQVEDDMTSYTSSVHSRSTSFNTEMEAMLSTEFDSLANMLGISRLNDSICMALDRSIVDLSGGLESESSAEALACRPETVCSLFILSRNDIRRSPSEDILQTFDNTSIVQLSSRWSWRVERIRRSHGFDC